MVIIKYNTNPHVVAARGDSFIKKTMTHISLPAYVRQILTKLHTSGYEAYAVGGCVRDALLGRPIGDYDITTSATPRQIKRLFRRSIDTGIEHGTVTVLIGDDKCEVTTYRLDGTYTDRRRPDSVTFASSLAEDLKRRDFTINALAYSDETGIIDMYDGISDLESRTIRCVGEPRHRFGEDALRMLRAIRFSAQLSFDIESLTYEAINALAPTISYVSKERIYVELSKILMSDHPEYISLVHDTGISRYIADGFADIDAGMDGLDVAALPKDLALRWASFFYINLQEIEKVRRILRTLKIDNATLRKVLATLTMLYDRPATTHIDRYIKMKACEHGWDVVEGYLAILLARGENCHSSIFHADESLGQSTYAVGTTLHDTNKDFSEMPSISASDDIASDFSREQIDSRTLSVRVRTCTEASYESNMEKLVLDETISKHTVHKYSDVSKNSTPLDSYIKELEMACDTSSANGKKRDTQGHGTEKRSTKERVHIQTTSGYAPMSHQIALGYMARTRQLRKSGAPIRVSGLAITGNDLKQKLSLTEGRLIGTVLTALLMCTYDRPELNTYETLLWLAEDMQILELS